MDRLERSSNTCVIRIDPVLVLFSPAFHFVLSLLYCWINLSGHLFQVFDEGITLIRTYGFSPRLPQLPRYASPDHESGVMSSGSAILYSAGSVKTHG